MDYTNDILARLQRGESADNIAAQITKNLNDANILYAKKKAEAKRQKEKYDNKVRAAEQLLDGLYGLLALYDADDELLKFFDECSPEELVNELDSALPTIQTIVGLSAPSAPKAPTGEPAPKGVDPIDEFLNRFVR